LDLTDPKIIKSILKEYNTFAQKKLGQHFLIDQDVLDNIISTAKLKSDDIVLEIGPGLGTLTRALSSFVKQVIAVEKDPEIIRVFKSINSDLTGVEIVQNNALMLDRKFFKTYLDKPYKLIANLPYYLTSAIIRFFLQNQFSPDMMVLMVQKEVAERIIAVPPNANLLSIAVRFYGQPEIISDVSKNAFWPQPKVNSAIIKIIPYKKGRETLNSDEKIFQTIKAGFSKKRKQLHNSLASNFHLDNATIKKVLTQSNIKNSRRAQTLTIPEWIKLHQNLQKALKNVAS